MWCHNKKSFEVLDLYYTKKLSPISFCSDNSFLLQAELLYYTCTVLLGENLILIGP